MLEPILSYGDEAQYLASLFLAAAAWRWGGNPDRAVTIVFVSLFTLPSIIFPHLSGRAIVLLEDGAFQASVDIVAAIAFTAIALNANRNYTLVIAGLQLVAASSHGVRFVFDAVSQMAHTVMVVGPSYFQLLIMAIGLWRHIKRVEKYGKYRDWRMPPVEVDYAALAKKGTGS